MKILMTGGGTGGHLYPALAVAETLKTMHKETEILFVGSSHGLENREVPEAGYPFKGLETVGFPRRRFSPRSLRAAWSFGRAVLRARAILREFAPHVVFSTGGYASAPVVAASRWEGIPIILQEQNSVPGITNRIASRLASQVHVAFASSRSYFPKRGHIRLSGNPLRAQVLNGSPSRALRLFRLDEHRTTVLVFGGSQGAHSINQAITDALPHFSGREDIQFLIQSGTNDYESVLAKCREVQVRTWVRRFISNMGDAYALADLVVCRAGAMTISELAACGLPSILIPYPHAAANHQYLNAEQLQDAGAAIVVRDTDLNGARLAEEIGDLLADRRLLRQMSVHALRMARPDAAERIARALLRYRPAEEQPMEPVASERPAPRGSASGRRGGRGAARSGSSGRVRSGGAESVRSPGPQPGETAARSTGPAVGGGSAGSRRNRRRRGGNGSRGGKGDSA